MAGAHLSTSLFTSRFEAVGAPLLRFFVGPGTMLPTPWTCASMK